MRAMRLLASGPTVGGADEPSPVPLDAAVNLAPVGEVVVAALRAVDRGGTVAIDAIHLDRIPAFDADLPSWERSLRSVAKVTRADSRALVALAAGIAIRTETVAFVLDEANEALASLAAGRVAGTAVLRADPASARLPA